MKHLKGDFKIEVSILSEEELESIVDKIMDEEDALDVMYSEELCDAAFEDIEGREMTQWDTRIIG